MRCTVRSSDDDEEGVIAGWALVRKAIVDDRSRARGRERFQKERRVLLEALQRHQA